MSEKHLWLDMKKDLPAASLARIDAYMVPDVNVLMEDGRAGWIELKDLDSWPIRETTRKNLGLRNDQSIWLFNYARAGGICYILIHCGNDYLLFDGKDAPIVAKGLTRSESILLSRLHCFGEMDWLKLGEMF